MKSALADPRGRQGCTPLSIQFLSFSLHAVLGEIWPNNKPPILWGWRPHLENPASAPNLAVLS